MTKRLLPPVLIATCAWMALLFVGGLGISQAVPPESKLGPGVQAAATRETYLDVIVTLAEPAELQRSGGPDVGTLRSQVAAVQAKALGRLPHDEFVVTRRYEALPSFAGRVTPEGLADLQANPYVAQVALNGFGDAGMLASVPMIHANETFGAGVTGTGQMVAVLDTGIDTDHPDLADSIAYEVCILSSGGCPAPPHVAEDDQGHGTNVAGIITSNGTIAPRGVAPAAQVAAYKVLTSSGGGLFGDWLAALDDIIANHPEVDFVNMSLQSSFACPNAAFDVAVQTLRTMGIGTIVAAGNHGTKQTITLPGCIEGAISVGAVYDGNIGSSPSLKSSCSDPVTAADQVACWSDSSPELDMLAPGGYITSTSRTGGSVAYIGTSQAAPHVAALGALLKQALPALSLDDTFWRMRVTGTVLTDDLDDADPETNRQTPRIDARVALLLDDNEDYDGDGCTNGQEYGTDQNAGGMRNPLLEWDYMNPTGDGMNRVDDVIAVVDQYFIDQGEPGYTTATDRTYIGPHAWSLGPPNGRQRIDDVIAAITQYFADC